MRSSVRRDVVTPAKSGNNASPVKSGKPATPSKPSKTASTPTRSTAVITPTKPGKGKQKEALLVHSSTTSRLCFGWLTDSTDV